MLLSLLMIFAGLVGGGWAYYRFSGERTFNRRVAVNIHQTYTAHASDLLVFRLVIVNIGNVKVIPNEVRRACPKRKHTRIRRSNGSHSPTKKTVNGSDSLKKQMSSLRQKQRDAQTRFVADEILTRYGDQHSKRRYRLVAAKIPYDGIQQAMSEIRDDGGSKAPGPRVHCTHREVCHEAAGDDEKFDRANRLKVNKGRRPRAVVPGCPVVVCHGASFRQEYCR